MARPKRLNDIGDLYAMLEFYRDYVHQHIHGDTWAVEESIMKHLVNENRRLHEKIQELENDKPNVFCDPMVERRERLD